MTIQQKAHQEFCSLAKESKSNSIYLLMRLGDLLYKRHNVSVYLKDAGSIKNFSDEQARLVRDLLPELDDGGGDVSASIQEAAGF
ncbi:MAG: hypothetical protein ACOYUZ_01355 [Patescibacteria group bacterium]